MTDNPLKPKWEICADGACKRYGENVLFRNLHFCLSPGRAVRIDGWNGSGKTQLLYALCGLVAIDAGRITIKEETTAALLGSPYVRDKICRFIPASPSGLTHLSVGEFFHVVSRSLRPYSLVPRSRAAKQTFARFRPMLEEATGRVLDPRMRVSELSIGQQKRLMLSATVYCENPPNVLAIDEPLAALDAGGVRTTIRILQEARGRGMALAIAEHQAQIEAIGFDETITMPFGIQCKEVNPQSEKVEAVTPLPINLWGGLTLRNVDAGYPGCRVYCEHFELGPSEVAHLSGENGSGKTGLLKALLGIAPAALIGGLQFGGNSMIDLSKAMQRAEVRYMSQSRDSFPSLRVADAMRVASASNAACDPVLLESIASIDKNKRVSDLSSGNLALLSLAQTLAVRPRLAILDEPFANVDGANVVKMAAMIAHARQEFGTAFLIVEHGKMDWPGMAHYKVEQEGNRTRLRCES